MKYLEMMNAGLRGSQREEQSRGVWARCSTTQVNNACRRTAARSRGHPRTARSLPGDQCLRQGHNWERRAVTDAESLSENVTRKNSTTEEEMKKFNAMVALFKRYANEYDFDYLMLGAQGFQESRLDQSVHSPAGAVGVMQIKPSTAADPTVGIKGVETSADNNVHAGVKYLRFIVNQYFKDAKMDSTNTVLDFESKTQVGTYRKLRSS